MVEEATIRYILFEYISGWEPEFGYPLAVLTLAPGDPGVRLYTTADWMKHVPEQAIPLLEGTFADWESLSPEEAARSFPHLAQSSAGSFQAKASGTCTGHSLLILLGEQLGIQAS